MAKYLTEFNTYADYSGATLSLPNVSLIKNTGKVYYKNIYAGAVVGDILMWDVANQKLVATLNAQWDATTYPIADYVPVAVNAIPASETPDGKARWVELNDRNYVNWSKVQEEIGGISDQDVLSGKNYTNTVLNFSGFTAENYILFNGVNTFVTSGTSAGDWFLPSLGELKVAYTHKAEINASLAAIRTVLTSLATTLGTGNYVSYWSSTEANAGAAYVLYFSDGRNASLNKSINSSSSSNHKARAFLSI